MTIFVVTHDHLCSYTLWNNISKKDKTKEWNTNKLNITNEKTF
jgi:hypothetical protein